MHNPVLAVGLTLVFASLLRALIEPYVVSSGSMRPTLRPGDRVLALKACGLFRPAKVGDIVVLRMPAGSRTLSPRNPTVKGPKSCRESRPRELIKRVVAKGHDTVLISDGVVFVNELASRRVGKNPANLRFGPCEVPGDSLFVLGEDLDVSRDSREFGAVPRSLLLGRAFAVYWPVTRIRFLWS